MTWKTHFDELDGLNVTVNFNTLTSKAQYGQLRSSA